MSEEKKSVLKSMYLTGKDNAKSLTSSPPPLCLQYLHSTEQLAEEYYDMGGL
jgi:hypothetical protein